MATDDTPEHVQNKALHPEQVAHDWHIEANRESQTRLNYWLLTEGLLLTAFAAAGEESLGSESHRVRLALSIGGIFFTLVWHSLMIRIWSWNEWYFARVRFLHSRVWGQPEKYDDATNLGAYPPRKHWTYAKGSGLGVKYGIHLLTAAFYVVWSVMVWVVWKNMYEAGTINVCPNSVLWTLGIAGVLVTLWTAYVEGKALHERKKLKDV